MTGSETASPFRVPAFLHALGGMVHRFPSLWIALARLETASLADAIAAVRIDRPVFVSGLARSGSTLLHETIASSVGFASHRIKDYPMLFTPCWWRQAIRVRVREEARERAHGDGMLVTSESPDALEEMLWMAFFPRSHDPKRSNLLDAGTSHPDFEAFYRNHLRKLLHAENARRYAAKANCHVARLAYLHRLFSDAKFVIPVRNPAGHIVSLMRQHERFRTQERRYPRALAYMRWSGHFEFGLDRRPIHVGDDARTHRVLEAWKRGDEVLGWAVYWAMLHDHLANQLEGNASLRRAAVVVRFEDLCANPRRVLARLAEHCGLEDGERMIDRFAPAIRMPAYYASPLDASQMETIERETSAAAQRWGYA